MSELFAPLRRRLDARRAEADRARGEAALAQGRAAEAAEALAAATERAPAKPSLWRRLIEAHEAAGDLDAAAEAARRGAAANPDNAGLASTAATLTRQQGIARAKAALAEGDAAEAHARAVEACEADEGHAPSWRLRARAARDLERLEEAAESVATALALRPGWPPAVLLAADVALRRGDAAGAAEVLTALEDASALSLEQRRRAARLALEAGQGCEAARFADAALAEDPADKRLHRLHLSALATCHGDASAAPAVAIDAAGADAERLTILAERLLALRRFGAVRDAAGRLADPPARLRLAAGLALERSGRLTEADLALAPLCADDVDEEVAARARRRREAVAGRLAALEPDATIAIPAPTPADPAPGRVLHVVARGLADEQVGHTIRTQQIARGQQQVGLEPHVGIRVAGGEEGEAASETIDGVDYHRLVPAGTRSSPRLDERLAAAAEGLAALAERLRPALLHPASTHENADIARPVAQARGLPMVYEARGFVEESRLAQLGDDGSRQIEAFRLDRAAEDRALADADAVVTLGEAMRSALVERGVPEGKITLVPNAVDAERFRPQPRDEGYRATLGVEPEEVLVGYITRVTSFEGIPLLVDAVLALREAGHPVRGVLVGDGPGDEDVAAHVAARGAEEAFLMPGRVPHDEIVRVYASLDVFVCPRVDELVTRLVTPLKPLEAMAMALPVVLADLPALAELSDGGRLGQTFAAGDAEDLARVLEGLVGDPDGRAALGRSARQWVATERTWEANAERYRELYSRLGVTPAAG